MIPAPLLFELFTDAQAYRYAAAGVTFLALFVLGFAAAGPARLLTWEWRVLVWAMTAQQGVISYVTYVRASATPPPGFPTGTVDPPLVAVLLSAVAMLFAGVCVFVAQRTRRE